MHPDSAIEIENLMVEFATEFGTVAAVRDLSLTIRRGETVVLVGDSGSGKSVTALAIMQLVRRPAGRVRASAISFRRRDGPVVDLARLPERQMRRLRGNEIAMIFQEPMTSLNPVLTVGAPDRRGSSATADVGRAEAHARSAVELLDASALPDPERRARELSAPALRRHAPARR